MAKNFNKMSESLGGSILKLYKVGGLMLVFIFVGTLTMAGGNFFGGGHSGLIVAVGASVTLACLGLFGLTQVQAVKTTQRSRDFCDLIKGRWWERITPEDASALSFVTMEIDSATGTLRMNGDAFDVDGKLLAKWESVASCANEAERKVFYYWRGRHALRPAEPYEGFGEISFHMSAGQIDRGDGVFSDTNLSKLESTTRKGVILRRCADKKEAEVMESSDANSISDLVRAKLKQIF